MSLDGLWHKFSDTRCFTLWQMKYFNASFLCNPIMIFTLLRLVEEFVVNLVTSRVHAKNEKTF